MTSPKERYSAEDVLQHVDDPTAFMTAFRDALLRREEAKQAFVDELSPETKAEWIDGEPVYHSPARRGHNATRHAIETLLGILCAGDLRNEVSSEKAMMKVMDNLYEPDVAVWVELDSEFEDEMIIYPPCDLVVEVLSKKTAKTDRGSKFINYAKAGITEFWIVDVDKEKVEQYLNEDSAYAIHSVLGFEDTVRSSTLAGLELPVAAFFSQSHFAKAVVAVARALTDRLERYR